MPSFNGRFYRIPTVAISTNTTQLTSFGLAPGGVVAMLGSATGGIPNTVQRFTDPESAQTAFRGGDLVTAAQLAWQHGAQVIYMTRIGSALQSSATITGAASSDIATITSKDYGSYTIGIQYKVEAGTVSGNKFTVKLYDSLTNRTTIESIDNAANIGEVATYFNTTLPSTLVTITTTSSASSASLVGYTSLTGGSDGSPVTADWSTGLALYNTQFVNIMHPAGSSDETVHALFKTHVETYSNQKRERTAIVGSPANPVIGDINTAGSLVARAYNLNSERVVLVAPGTDEQSGAFTAAKVVGIVAQNDVATPVTYKTISATSIDTKYSESEKETLIQAGVLVVEEVPQGRRIVRGITTVQDPSQSVEDPFKEYSIVRIKDYITDNVRTILETTYIGKKGISGVTSQMQSTVASVLGKLKEAQIIVGYQNIVVNQDVNNPQVFTITYQVAPVSPVNFIFVTQYLVNALS
jgi:hypothetical protein